MLRTIETIIYIRILNEASAINEIQKKIYLYAGSVLSRYQVTLIDIPKALNELMSRNNGMNDIVFFL